MKKYLTSCYSFILIAAMLLVSVSVKAVNYTWNGSSSTAWNTTTNWTPNGLPDSLDNVTISNSTTNSPILSQNRKVNNLTVSNDSINLGGFTLTFKGAGNFSAGVIYNGTLQGRSSSASATFSGTKIDCTADIIHGYIRLSGSTFEQTAYFEDAGAASGVGNGGCTFNADVTIKHTGSGTYFTLANTTGDTFNGNLVLINTSTHAINIAHVGTTYFNGNVEVNCTNIGGIQFSASTGSSELASGKTLSVGSSGFTKDYLNLQRFTQLGSTSQSLTLTDTANVNMISCVWNGGLTISAPGILMKNSTFHGTTSLTRTGKANHHSDGGNVFNGTTTIANNGTAGRMRLAVNNPDTFNGNVTFNSTGQDLQVAYSGNNVFAGNITLNSNKVVFNTSTGRVTLSGTASQTLNGSVNFPFYKLTFNKSSNHVTANTTVSVDDSLVFTQGNLITTSTNLLTMKAGSLALSASNNSFVSGPIKKVGNSAFTFPTGKSSSYRAIEMTAPSNASDAFTAEYFNSGQSLGYSRDATIKFIDNCNYWNLARTTGSSSPNIKLNWSSSSCGLMDSATSRVINWNGSTWKDLGNGGITGNITTGKITNSTSVVTYGNFTIGYNTCVMTAYTVSSGDTAKVRTLNGTPSYTYLWSAGGTDSTKLGLSAGTTYTVTVTDGSGCTALANYYKIFSKITGTPLTSESNNSYYSTWGDYDKDGDLDLFHSLFSTAPNNTNGNNFLFQNSCNGDLLKVNAIPGGLVSDGLTGNYSRWVDIDNDDDLDLYVGPNIIYENQNNGSFLTLTDDKKINTLPTYSPGIRDFSFADYDNDGELDAYGGRHEIYQGDGSGSFNELSESSLSVINSSTTRGDAVSWADYDNDGFMDIFIANSYSGGPNYLLKNDGDGTFTNITSITNLTAAQGSYGCAWGDIDNDLDLDIWITNNSSGDRLFINNGSGSFTQNTNSDIVTNTYTNQAGAAWADYDNDGDLDLFVPTFNKNFLFNNNGSGSFTKDVIEIVSMDASVESYGAGWVDYDNDGDLDLYVPTAFGHPNDLFYTNNLNGASGHNWIKVNCKGVTSNKMAIGARIYVKATIGGMAKWQMREINGNTTRGGESGGISSSVVHFGLGNASTIDSLKVVWPASSTTQIFTNVDVNEFIEITEGINSIVDIIPCEPDLPIPNPGYVSGRVYFDTNSNCVYEPGIDYPIANKAIQAEAGAYFTFTNDSGEYIMGLPLDNFDISTNFVPDNWILSSCQVDSLINVNVIANDTIENLDFSEEARIVPCDGQYDLSINPVSIDYGNCENGIFLNNPCPGFTYRFCFNVHNASLLPAPVGSVFVVTFPSTFLIYNWSNPSFIFNPISPFLSNTISFETNAVIPIGGTFTICLDVLLDVSATPPFITTFDFQNPGFTLSNLLTNGDFETCDNTGFTSSYTYVPSPGTGSAAPGQYFVDSGTIGYNGATWNGPVAAQGGTTCFLFADGATGSATVWQEIISVSPNTRYTFAGWCNNIFNPTQGAHLLPDVQGWINFPNSLLFTTPQLNVNSWQNFSTSWCSESNTQATIILRATQGNGGASTYGNDFALDELTFFEAIAAPVSLSQPDSCGCDPNDKLVTPQGCGIGGNVEKMEKLTYKIRFQNTGTGNAHDVIIRDKINPNLDARTLEIVAVSDSITEIQIIPDSVLIISFNDIELEPDSIGFVTFSIYPKTGLPDGTQITNQAGIYFDNNSVVLTNVTLNTLYDIPNPEAFFTYKHDCSNTGLVYDFEYAGNTSDNAIFSWSFADGTPSTSTAQNPNNVTFSSTGYKIVILTVERFGCTTSMVDTILIEDFIVSGDSVIVCHGDGEILIHTSALDSHLGHGDCIGHCPESSRVAENKPVQLNSLNCVKLLPNPANTDIRIQVFGNYLVNQNIIINLVSHTGNVVNLYNGLPSSQNNLLFELKKNIEEISSGLYLLHVQYGSELKSLKLVVQH